MNNYIYIYINLANEHLYTRHPQTTSKHDRHGNLIRYIRCVHLATLHWLPRCTGLRTKDDSNSILYTFSGYPKEGSRPP